MKHPAHDPARPEDERLSLGKTYVYGLQHILTMYGGVIAPPLIVGGAAGLSTTDIALLVSAALFVSGAATLLQTLGLPYVGANYLLCRASRLRRCRRWLRWQAGRAD